MSAPDYSHGSLASTFDTANCGPDEMEQLTKAIKPATDKFYEAVDENFENSSKKKPQSLDSSDLVKLKSVKLTTLKTIPHSKNKIISVVWGQTESDTRLAAVDQLGVVFVWDSVKKSRLYGCNAPFTQCMAISPDKTPGKAKLLVGGMKNATELYEQDGDEKVLKLKKTWILHDGYISSLHFLDGGSKYISSSGDADIRIFDLSANQTEYLQVLRGHTKDCQAINFPANDESKNVFITCSSDKTVKLWDRRMGGRGGQNACTATFISDSELNSCTFFPSGSLIAAGGQKDKTYLWDVRSTSLVSKYARNNMITSSCAFSKSGRTLYVGHDDGAIISWDIFSSGENKAYALKTEAHVTYYEGTKNIDNTSSRVNALSVNSDGFLASAGFDGKVKIWSGEATA